MQSNAATNAAQQQSSLASSITAHRLSRMQQRGTPASRSVDIIYLVIDPDVCGGPRSGYSMLEKLEHSLRSLRTYMPTAPLHLYSLTFDGSRHQSLAARTRPYGAIVHHVGKFVLTTVDSSVSASDNLLRDILIQKVETLARHEAEAVLVDVDTEWTRALPPSLPPSMHRKEEYSLTGPIRSLAHVWRAIGRAPPPAYFHMWNSGFVHIPLTDRPQVIALVRTVLRELATQPGARRMSNVLDEQLALSYAMQSKYGERLSAGAPYLLHHWQTVHNGRQYWAAAPRVAEAAGAMTHGTHCTPNVPPDSLQASNLQANNPSAGSQAMPMPIAGNKVITMPMAGNAMAMSFVGALPVIDYTR